ncbi:MAG: ABC transporter substrate-binding protein, partial [Spirochaetales bacterium]|nr:ABC transporter substrate-binding protein [Spirochaetales bacterium]
MKKLLLTILLFTLHLAIFSSPAKEDLNTGKFIVEIGTTAVIEKAEVGEYAYDMLTSGFSNLPLVSKDTNGVYSPLVASFDTQDSKTWNYEITPGLTWSDGVEVTAEDILFTLIYEDQNGSANFIDQIDSKGKVTESKYIGYTLSEDKKTLSLVLREANIRELSNMTSFRIVPSHLYSDGDITIADKRVTCGPFVFSSFDGLSGTIEFVQNKFYPVKPNVEKIVVHLFGSEDTMYMALNNGDLDFTFIYNSGVSENYLEVLNENNNLEVLSTNSQGIPLVLAFNNSSAKLSDVNLRKAISYALDYEVIRKYVGGSGSGIANRGVVPSSTFGYIETQKLEQNLSLAATLLQNSGYEKVGAYYQKDGEVLSLTLSYRLDKTAQVAGAELIKTQLETFGIKVN